MRAGKWSRDSQARSEWTPRQWIIVTLLALVFVWLAVFVVIPAWIAARL